MGIEKSVMRSILKCYVPSHFVPSNAMHWASWKLSRFEENKRGENHLVVDKMAESFKKVAGGWIRFGWLQ